LRVGEVVAEAVPFEFAVEAFGGALGVIPVGKGENFLGATHSRWGCFCLHELLNPMEESPLSDECNCCGQKL
jgi:hypothetical protein